MKKKILQNTVEKYKYQFCNNISSVVKKYSKSKHKEDNQLIQNKL